MTFDDLHKLFQAYEEATWSPTRTHVVFGCDCGCGGDSYSREQWDAEELQAQEAIDNMKALCIIMGVEYNGIE